MPDGGSYVCLQRAERFVEIRGKDEQYYGGDQAWFFWEGRKGQSHVARLGACGTVALANIAAYLSESNPAYGGLYPYPDYEKASFLAHMVDLYGYVRPFHVGKFPLGIWPVSRLARGMERFARARGVQLRAVWRDWGFSRGNVLRYVLEGLYKDRPLAMLVGTQRQRQVEVVLPGRGSYCQDLSLHWVTVTGVRMEAGTVKLVASTWGGQTLLDLDEYVRERIYAGVVYFE
ncbi:MAG: hypothetical protein HFG54_01015 [Lachnospiraceae bacterium]|nr:hypothetical protein [Lachnospiraceae bacterium]